MVTQLKSGFRVARKVHHCQMCGTEIKVGDRHLVSTNLCDGRVYDWRECQWCSRDDVLGFVFWWAGCSDEGVTWEDACEWAPDAALWAPKIPERIAARNWLARAAGDE